MREFKSIESYVVDGRKVLYVALDRDEDRDGLLDKLKAEGGVMIDGQHYQVDGHESFCVVTLRKGIVIGLRVADSAGETHE